MTYAALLVLLVTTWALVHLAAAWQASANGLGDAAPHDRRSEASTFVGHIAMPLACLTVAWVIDRLGARAGTILMASAHLLLLGLASTSLVRTVLRRHLGARRSS